MTKKEDKKERVRKLYAPKGSRSQKSYTFRIDNENVEWLELQYNKGRYINDLISAHRASFSDGK